MSISKKYLSILLNSEEFRLLEYNGLLHLDLSFESRFIWKFLLLNDEVIFLGEDLKYFIHATLTDKFISQNSLDVHFPLSLEFNLNDSYANLGYQNIGFPKRYNIIDEQSFVTLYNSIPKSSNPKITNKQTTKPIVFENAGYIVEVAKTKNDYDVISSFSQYHSFGLRSALMSLVCRHNERIIGAVLFDIGDENAPYHRLALNVFGEKYFELRKNGIFINRLYNDENVKNKLALHAALLTATINIAKIILGEQLTFIEGVSYDYHPVAEKLGFNIELPVGAYDSFYFWKPFHEYLKTYKRDEGLSEIKTKIHELIKKRAEKNYWIIIGEGFKLTKGINQKLWALRKNKNNIGRWRYLRSKDIVFFYSKNTHSIIAYGEVKKTKLTLNPRMLKYPLTIEFFEVFSSPKAIRIDERDFEKIYRPYFGGIFPITSKIGAYLKESIDNFLNKKKMWINPNPYLLHQTKFSVIPRQIFLIQAHSISQSILPVIKEILHESEYSLKYYTDRDGQVIFDDIWVLLNQSQAVIVDFTQKRPNVYLEYGMALVIGKPIVAITQEINDIPSDTPNLKYILYHDKKGDNNLELKLISAIEQTIEDIDALNNQSMSIFT